MNRKLGCIYGVVAAILVVGLAGAADDPVVLNTQDLKWEKCGDPPWDVCQRAVLRGDREKEPSEHLMRFPKGFKFERHWHDNPENVIVTEGAMVISFDGGKEQTVRRGGYVRVPPTHLIGVLALMAVPSIWKWWAPTRTTTSEQLALAS